MNGLPEYSESETAWLAGLLEGEGCFTLDSHSSYGSRGSRVMIEVKMTDLDVMEKVQRLFGGRQIFKREPQQVGWLPQYRVRIQGKKAKEVMRRIYPYMGSRRSAKIDELLAG